MEDRICIEELELQAQIGVTTAERAASQRLTVSLRLEPRRAFAQLGDELANTVDYHRVCTRVQEIAALRERNLIETLGEEIAAAVLREFEVQTVDVELRKYVLPRTRYVGVTLRRSRTPSGN